MESLDSHDCNYMNEKELINKVRSFYINSKDSFDKKIKDIKLSLY